MAACLVGKSTKKNERPTRAQEDPYASLHSWWKAFLRNSRVMINLGYQHDCMSRLPRHFFLTLDMQTLRWRTTISGIAWVTSTLFYCLTITINRHSPPYSKETPIGTQAVASRWLLLIRADLHHVPVDMPLIFYQCTWLFSDKTWRNCCARLIQRSMPCYNKWMTSACALMHNGC